MRYPNLLIFTDDLKISAELANEIQSSRKCFTVPESSTFDSDPLARVLQTKEYIHGSDIVVIYIPRDAVNLHDYGWYVGYTKGLNKPVILLLEHPLSNNDLLVPSCDVVFTDRAAMIEYLRTLRVA